MEDNKLLVEGYEFYYNIGLTALQEKDFAMAKKCILIAAEALLSIAKDSSGVIKAQRLKRAKELYDMAHGIVQM